MLVLQIRIPSSGTLVSWFPGKGRALPLGQLLGQGCLFTHKSRSSSSSFSTLPPTADKQPHFSLSSFSASDHCSPASALTPTRTSKFLSISLEAPSGLSLKKASLMNWEKSDHFSSPILFKQEASQTLQMKFSPTGEEYKWSLAHQQVLLHKSRDVPISSIFHC